MAVVSINRSDVDTILSTAGTGFLSVQFFKKDMSIRNLNGHLKVVKHLKGGESTIAHKENLVSIWDRNEKSYKCFDKNRLIQMRVNGNLYKIKD